MFRTMVISICMLVMIACPALGQTPEENLAAYKAQFDAMNAHDLETMMSYWAEDSVWDIQSSPPPAPKMYVEMGLAQRFAARPDFHMTEGRVLASGNVVVEEALTVYTDGPTGVEVILPHITIYDFEGGLIKKATSYNDKVGPMIQRGEMPAADMPELIPSFVLPDAEPTGLAPTEVSAAEYAERWSRGDLVGLAQMIRPDAEIFMGPLGAPMDRNAYIALEEMYLQSFADHKAERVRAVDLGDGWVLSEVIFSGTHTEDYLGVPAEGRLFHLRGVTLDHFDADGLVTYHSAYYDNLTLMTQITTDEWSLDGVWVTSYPTPAGTLLTSTVYVAQDAAKTQYSGTLEWLNAIPIMTELYPDYDPALGISAGGQATKVGRHQYKATFLGYERKPATEIGGIEIVGIWIAHANFELIGSDRLQGHGTVSYYMAAQDVDQDGFPDDDQEPIVCAPWEWSGRRVTDVPACTPVPMP
jgi:steroid delta-isomerase-like uncharacterized protein